MTAVRYAATVFPHNHVSSLVVVVVLVLVLVLICLCLQPVSQLHMMAVRYAATVLVVICLFTACVPVTYDGCALRCYCISS